MSKVVDKRPVGSSAAAARALPLHSGEAITMIGWPLTQEGLMPKANVFPIRKPAAQHQAETANIDGELCTIATELDRAALAELGLINEIDESNPDGESIADWLRGISAKVNDIVTRLSPIDIDATKRALEAEEVRS
jgi:enoyl-CoA hydratase/carnithine racemase